MNNPYVARLNLPDVSSMPMVRRVSPHAWLPAINHKLSTSPTGLGWQQYLPTVKKETLLTPITNSHSVPPYPESNTAVYSTTRYFHDPKDKDYGSILKKENNMNGYMSDGTVRRSQRSRRKVAFKNSVSVYWYDSDAESTSSRTEHDRINTELQVRRISFDDTNSNFAPREVDFVAESDNVETTFRGYPMAVHSSNKRADKTLGYASSKNVDSLPGSTFHMGQNESMNSWLPQQATDNLHPFCATLKLDSATSFVQHPKFTVTVDPVTFQKKLVAVIQLSQDLHPHDILVKANKNGNKIRIVMANDIIRSNSVRYNASKHFYLPVQVDPYQLSAHLDSDGVLHIEAPVQQ